MFKELMRSEETVNIPVIALSAGAILSYVSQVLKMGFDFLPHETHRCKNFYH